MRLCFTLFAAVALMAVGPAVAAPLGFGTKPIDLTFLDRLRANQVPFSTQPMVSADPTRASTNLPEIAENPRMQKAAEEILDRLLSHHPGPKPAHIAFIITTTPDFNCATLLTGEIACNAFVLDQLLKPLADGNPQFAFMLAHELGHRLIAGHGERFAKSDKLKANLAQIGMMTAFALNIALSKRTMNGNTLTIQPTPAATSAFWNGLLGGVYAGETASGLASLSWSQKEEDEADQYGMYLMQLSGYEISAPGQLFDALERRVKAHDLRHDSMIQTVATKAAAGAATSAVTSGTNWINVASGAGAAALSSMDQISSNHYHRDYGERSVRAAAIAKALETKLLSYLGDDFAAQAAGQEMATTEVATAAAPAPNGKHNVRGKLARNTHTPPAPPKSPPTTWELALSSRPEITEIVQSHKVMEVLATKGHKDAVSLCPTHPTTTAMALNCGLAFAADGQVATAESLFKQTLADSFASPRMFRQVAFARSRIGGPIEAMQTLDAADAKFPGGQFYPDRITLLLQSGDEAGAKAVAETCKTSTTAAIRTACFQVMAQKRTVAT